MNEYILLVYNNDTQFKPAQAQGICRRVPDLILNFGIYLNLPRRKEFVVESLINENLPKRGILRGKLWEVLKSEKFRNVSALGYLLLKKTNPRISAIQSH